MPNLHSTMYLLNLGGKEKIMTITMKFTFHYVSIKSLAAELKKFMQVNLHSTMYLLNLFFNL